MTTELSTTGLRLRFGARGWRHSAWLGGYYPEDLPEEWQLGYYANELNCVLLPAAEWVPASSAQIAEWRDEVGEDFRFFLEWPAEAVEDLETKALQFGNSLGGVLLSPGVEGAADLPLLREEEAHGDDIACWRGAGIGACRLAFEGLDLRAQRRRLEGLAPTLAAGETALFITGSGMTPTRIRELQTVAELLGIA